MIEANSQQVGWQAWLLTTPGKDTEQKAEGRTTDHRLLTTDY